MPPLLRAISACSVLALSSSGCAEPSGECIGWTLEPSIVEAPGCLDQWNPEAGPTLRFTVGTSSRTILLQAEYDAEVVEVSPLPPGFRIEPAPPIALPAGVETPLTLVRDPAVDGPTEARVELHVEGPCLRPGPFRLGLVTGP